MGLIFEFLQKFVVLVIDGPPSEEEQVLRLMPPGLQPVGPSGDRPKEESLEPFEGIAVGCHAASVAALTCPP